MTEGFSFFQVVVHGIYPRGGKREKREKKKAEVI